jgi:UDP-N-acetylmuramoylalanine--D-glutamate ligase
LEKTKATKIGITGSDGKTTTSTALSQMLENERRTHLVGNIGKPLISQMEKIEKSDFVVCELSSFQLFDYTPTLDAALVTSVSPNHLDWHSSMADYIFSKRNVLKKSRKAVVNFDSSYREFFTHSNIAYYSLSDLSSLVGNGASYTYIKNGYVYFDSQRLFPLEFIKIKGSYNILNILGATTLALDYVSLDSIIKTVKEFRGVSHRAETVASIDGVTFVDSSIDSTPTRTKSTLSSFSKEKSIVIMGGYDKNLSYDLLEDALSGVKAVVLLGENKEKIYGAIKDSPQKIIIVNNIIEATEVAYKEAQKGDYVILSPASASFDMFKNYKERSEKFKESIRGLENGKAKRNFKRIAK